MSISISEPMRVALDALYEGKPAPPEVLASLTDDERAQVASLARTARFVGLSLNQPVPTSEMQASALARAHAEMAARPASLSSNPNLSEKRGEPEPNRGNWFTRLFGRKTGG